MLITGPESDLTRILAAQDRAAYLPLPPSVYRNGQRINVCPECMTEIEGPSLSPWQCSECGWVAGQPARTTCVESLCTAVLIEGEHVAQVAWPGQGEEAGQAKGLGKGGGSDPTEAGLAGGESGAAKGRTEDSDLTEAGLVGGGSDLAEAFSRVSEWSPAKPVEAVDSGESDQGELSERPDPA